VFTTAVASFVGDARFHRREIPELGPLAAVFTGALAAASERTEALEILQQMAMWTKTDVTGLLDQVLEVLRSGKPAQIEYALAIFKQHAYAIKRGRVQWEARAKAAIPEIVRHSRTLDGSRKVTKVVIAARYALGAYAELDLDAEQRRTVEAALARVASVH
jgi:acetoacetate decarboxylase